MKGDTLLYIKAKSLIQAVGAMSERGINPPISKAKIRWAKKNELVIATVPGYWGNAIKWFAESNHISAPYPYGSLMLYREE